jgi:hypothetical protein
VGPAIDDDCLQSGQFPGQGLSTDSIRLDGEDAGCTQHTFGIFACPNTRTVVLEKRPNTSSAKGLYAAKSGVEGGGGPLWRSDEHTGFNTLHVCVLSHAIPVLQLLLCVVPAHSSTAPAPRQSRLTNMSGAAGDSREPEVASQMRQGLQTGLGKEEQEGGRCWRWGGMLQGTPRSSSSSSSTLRYRGNPSSAATVSSMMGVWGRVLNRWWEGAGPGWDHQWLRRCS